jgi:hypothetical protein
MKIMSSEEKEILETFEILLPKLNDIEKAQILGIGKGLLIKIRNGDEVREII